MAEDKMKGKASSGLFSQGQGPVLGQTVSGESSSKSIPDSLGSGYHLKVEKGGSTPPTPSGSEEKGFDLHSKSYAGPQNWVPENKGTSNPFDVKGK